MPKGRPKKDETRSKSYRIRMYPDEYERLKKVSNDSKMSIADFIRVGVESVTFGEYTVFRREEAK